MKPPSRNTWLGLGAVILVVVVLIELSQPRVQTVASVQNPHPVKTLDSQYQTHPWTSFSVSGNGTRETESFYVGTQEWRLCGTVRDLTLTQPRPIYLRAYDEQGRSVGNTSFEGLNGDTACSVIRSGPGRYYININAGIGWTVEATP